MFRDFGGEVPVGIDLGTTNSCISIWNGKEIITIPNRVGERTTPSIIYVHDGSFIIGENIQKEINLINESEKIYSLKRIIGQDYNNEGLIEEIKNLHYNIVKNNRTNKPEIKLNINEKNLFTPEELCSLILKKLVKDAQNFLGKKIKKVVISVPAYFDDAQRNATIKAAKLAELEVIRIINEPTAAALSYGLGQKFCPFKSKISSFSEIFKKNRNIRESQNLELFNIKNGAKNNSFCLIQSDNSDIIEIDQSIIKNDDINEKKKGKNVMVFDLGGGTFDLAILKLNLDKKEYEVKSKYSNKHLGGDDFDNKLVEYCLEQCGFDKCNINKKLKERLKKACEYAKRIINTKTNDIDEDNETTIIINNFFEGKDLVVRLTRKQFEEEICNDLFEKLISNFDELLEGAKIKKNEMEEIILVGGSTKMPKIKKLLQKEFSCKINDEINPDEVVSYGAAIQAAMLMCSGKNKNFRGITLFDITPISLGTDVINKSKDEKIQELGNKMSFIIDKWTPLPAKKSKTYRTTKDNQDSMKISIYEGENEYLNNNHFLDEFSLELPKKPKGEVEVEIIFEIDLDNILTVTAYDKSSSKNKKELKITSQKKENKIDIINNEELSKINSIKIYDDLKNKNKKKVEELINTYLIAKQNKKNDIIIKALEAYNEYIIENIKGINNINENNIEYYFYYVYQLLESYEEILYLRDYENEYNEKALNEIKKYINSFKKTGLYYIKEIIELYKGAKRSIFLEIFYHSIKILYDSGEDYLNNLQKMSRYYSKLYFEEIIKLYKKYINIYVDPLNNIKYDIDKIKNNSEQNLQNINSNAILLINISKNYKILINPRFNKEIYDNFLGESGFTYYFKDVNPINDLKDKEECNLILDELEKIRNELEVQIPQNQNVDKDVLDKLKEEKAICLGNIVKIKYIFQKGKDYNSYKNDIEDCLELAEQLDKNNKDCQWYLEASQIKEMLYNGNSMEGDGGDEEIEELFKPIKIKLDNEFAKDKQEFINYILREHPYDGYNINTRESYYNWDYIDRSLIEFLRVKYNPDKYQRNTKDEKLKYKIMENISQKLNSILEAM